MVVKIPPFFVKKRLVTKESKDENTDHLCINPKHYCI